jgi:phospholipase/carboxylesterase
MNAMNDALLETIRIETAPHPAVAVIWMHGLGADGGDFVSIVRELPLDGCPGIRFVFPHAPLMPVTINGGYVMRAWYDLIGTDLATREDAAGLRRSQAAIERLIEHEKSLGIPADRIILAGFSQGCAMALQVGLRYPERLAGLLCLSGYVPDRTTVSAERHPANHDTPIFLAHGSDDTVIPIDLALQSRDLLQALGHPVEWHEYAMPHAVCAEEIDAIGDWLRRMLT